MTAILAAILAALLSGPQDEPEAPPTLQVVTACSDGSDEPGISNGF